MVLNSLTPTWNLSGAFNKNELSCSGYVAFCTSFFPSTIHYTMPNMCNQNYIESKMKLVIFCFYIN